MLADPADRCIAGSLDGNDWGEDCLTANIFRPMGTKAGQKLPVVVYFHGGAFNLGAGMLFCLCACLAIFTMDPDVDPFNQADSTTQLLFWLGQRSRSLLSTSTIGTCLCIVSSGTDRLIFSCIQSRCIWLPVRRADGSLQHAQHRPVRPTHAARMGSTKHRAVRR